MRLILLLLCFFLAASLGIVVNKATVNRHKKSNEPNVYDDLGEDERLNPADKIHQGSGQKKKFCDPIYDDTVYDDVRSTTATNYDDEYSGIAVNKVTVNRYKKSNEPNVYDDLGDDERPDPADKINLGSDQEKQRRDHITIDNDTPSIYDDIESTTTINDDEVDD